MITPRIFSRAVTTRPEMIGGESGLHDGSNVFNAHTFVVLTAGFLASVASAGTSACGLCLDESKDSDVVNPPTKFFGDRHFPVALSGQRFLVSVTDASGHVGEANGAPQMSALTIGSSYGLLKLSNGNHALNVDNTTNLFFKVVEKPTSLSVRGIGAVQTGTTYNPIVVVEVVAAAIQTVG